MTTKGAVPEDARSARQCPRFVTPDLFRGPELPVRSQPFSPRIAVRGRPGPRNKAGATRGGAEGTAIRNRGIPARIACLALAFLLGLLASAGAGAEEAVRAPLSVRSLLLDGAAVGSRVVAVGERGHVLVSTDDGASWTQARVPTRVLLTAVHMHDARTGWTVGHDATILRTRDGGESWAVVHRAPEEELPLLDVWFRDGKTGFAIGAYGYFLATGDGGETWTRRAIGEDDFHLNALIPVAGRMSLRLYIAAEAGVVYRSDDAGATWRRLPSPYAGSWFGGLALDGNEVILAGLRGHLFRSDDAGESWTRVPTGTAATLTGVARLPSGSIAIVGLEGSVLFSGDGGRSVSSRRLPSREGISAVLPLADGGVLLIGEFGVRRLADR